MAELLTVTPSLVREFGYHGTSVEAIEQLAATGRMPVGGTSASEFYVFTAIRNRVWKHDAAEAKAAEYAREQLAWVHAAAKHFGSSPQTILHSCTDLSPAEQEEHGTGALLPSDDVKRFELEHRAAGYKGVVLAISSAGLGDLRCPPGWQPKPAGPGEAVYDAHSGLPIASIRRITPLSDTDRTFLEAVLGS